MGVDLSKEEFMVLPTKQQNAIIYDNMVTIKNGMAGIHGADRKIQNQINLGYAWLFILSSIMGIRKFLPF